LARNSAPERAEFAATLKPSYSAVLRHRWPLIALLLCTSTAWGTASLRHPDQTSERAARHLSGRRFTADTRQFGRHLLAE
jgi:hypothetical protein